MLFYEGLAAVRINGLFGYINTEGKVVIEPRFDLAGPFHDGFAEILVGKHTGVVAETGKVVLEPQFGRST
ncbi:WG repeat-containing protein, partial [Rhizobium johnstonii]|uniref:WG repeat-containing protein n=1 Tax=Rhizobium johnstonii TaxID=3019933 RepID=UPI003F9A66F1